MKSGFWPKLAFVKVKFLYRKDPCYENNAKTNNSPIRMERFIFTTRTEFHCLAPFFFF